LIVAVFGALFLRHVVFRRPRRGGTFFGIPHSHVSTLSATTPLAVAQAGSIQRGLVALNFMIAITRRNHA
jgi:hypothetical protein